MKIIQLQFVAAGMQSWLCNHNVRALICDWLIEKKKKACGSIRNTIQTLEFDTQLD